MPRPQRIEVRSIQLQPLTFALGPCAVAARERPQRVSALATPLARQLVAVARSFRGFYTNCPILAPENAPEVREARLALCVATARSLRQGLYLMGIQAPEEM